MATVITDAAGLQAMANDLAGDYELGRPTNESITTGDRTVVQEKPVLEMIRNVEMQCDGRVYVNKSGAFVYESRFHR